MDSAEKEGAGMNHTSQPSFGSCLLAFERRMVAVALLLMLVFCVPTVFSTSDAQRDGRWAILIVGASGNSDLQKTYLEEIAGLHSLLIDSFGFPREQIVVLFDDPEMEPDLIQYRATLENLSTVCRDLAGQVKREDMVFVFIDGHGSYNNQTYKLNLVGPDPTAELLAGMLYSVPARLFVVINATNSSGGSIPAFSQEGKIIITATKSGREGNLTHMGRFIADAFRDNASDSDKDGRVSIIEAYSYASYKVEEYYKNERNLQTEHAVLDDNGDGVAQGKPAPENGDGLLARTTFLDGGVVALLQDDGSPERFDLARQARDLEKQIEALKYSKNQLPPAEYQKKLEELLLELAKINLKMRDE